VHSVTGADLGRVAEVVNYGAGDVLMVDGGAVGAFDLPFAKAFVPQVDLAAGFLVVDLPDDFFDTPERPADEESEEDADEVSGQ